VKLGPRIIPHFRKIVQECVRVAREEFVSAENREYNERNALGADQRLH
jgi:hypothetical protein